jgi:hypothetical protein
MGYALQNNETFDAVSCGDCGIVFYVPEHWKTNRRETREGFYCPNGHCRAYKTSVTDDLRNQLAAKERALEWAQQRADTLNKRLNAEDHKRKRLDRRVAAGVCPCCHRTVKQLAAHMKRKHPEFAGKK